MNVTARGVSPVIGFAVKEATTLEDELTTYPDKPPNVIEHPFESVIVKT